MGLLQLITGPSNSTIGSILLDAATVEEHTFTATVTQDPIESGSVVTDHITLSPVAIRIEGVLSDTRLTSQLLAQSIAGNTSSASDRWDELLALYNARTPVDVVTELADYENMVLTGLVTSRTADAGKSLFITCNLVQVTIVESESTTVPANSPAAKAAKKGKKGTKKAGDKAADKGSLLLGAFKAFKS